MNNQSQDDTILVRQEGGKKLAGTLQKLIQVVHPGMTLKELDMIAENLLRETGGIPAFKGFDGFPGSICVSLNDGLVHGVPSDDTISLGDVLSIDIGLIWKGYYSDMAKTVIVGGTKAADDRARRFLQAGEQALDSAISKALVGNHVGDISEAMQKVVESSGYAVSRMYTGHGIGKELHTEPAIFCYGESGTGLKLKENTYLAIEVIYAEHNARSVTDPTDGWTVRTCDGGLGGLFEHTIVVSAKGPLVLTK